MRPNFSTFDRDCDALVFAKIKALDLSGKTIAQIPCNNGRELLSLMQLGTVSAFGFDLSDAAIAEAKELAALAQLNATFERVDVLEISSSYNSCFDFIYISEGSLQWFPHLGDFFAVIARLLKPEGQMLLFEIHPFAFLFEEGFNLRAGNIESLISYFDRGPHTYATGLDYVGGTEYEASECSWFLHRISEIITAVLGSGFSIQEFDEYNFELADNEQAKGLDKLPLSYLILGKKTNF
jgi:SAM-dependent methyltransferase